MGEALPASQCTGQSVHPGCCVLCWPSASPGFSFWNLDGETTFTCPCQVLLDGFHRGLLGPKIQPDLIKPVLTYIASPIFLESICHLDGRIKKRFKNSQKKMISLAQTLRPLCQSGSSCFCWTPFFMASPFPEPLKFSLLHPIALCMLVVVSLQGGLELSKGNINNC